MIRLHKTNDTVERHKNKFEEKTEILQIAEYLINNRYFGGDVRYFVYVDTENMKIRGKFTRDEVENAIHQYITERYARIVSPMLQIRDKKGKKVYTDETALKIANENLMKTYFNIK
jgi:hypothetical protein